MDELIKALEAKGVLASAALCRAFAKVDRAHFVPPSVFPLAYHDTALPIGWGQTISQPYTVAFMLELLAPQAGDHILDVGSGSGWQTAMLAEMVGRRGKVYAIELVRNLFEFGKKNIEQYPQLFQRVRFYCQNAETGLPQVAEAIAGFDAIIAAARVAEVPQAWRAQLKIGGRLVYPKANAIYREIKREQGWEVTKYPGFVFVPFKSSAKAHTT
ncbi:MAG: methyltransferase domain-containing protein [Candidatus Sungbacteria bacterium]|uniref:Protein-L-isoaspartate O-methyltransferase n=1 Tax=Candidatus Sungiibacteriota bacterium TaxID=2750080 RepID=A0A9D6LQ55_9BACT|nr:methyltransferase domain-containing protein [Candidatus Sungbacteria bacterium]